MEGDVLPRKAITNLDFIDLNFGQVDTNKFRIVSIDVNTRQPILEERPVVKTPEQLRIEELENQLLLLSGVI